MSHETAVDRVTEILQTRTETTFLVFLVLLPFVITDHNRLCPHYSRLIHRPPWTASFFRLLRLHIIFGRRQQPQPSITSFESITG